MLWLYDCICMILKATSESEVVENNNHVPEKFTEFDNQRKMEVFFLYLLIELLVDCPRSSLYTMQVIISDAVLLFLSTLVYCLLAR